MHAIDLLDEALWVCGMTCGIIAHEQKKLPEYFSIVKRAYTNLPPQLVPRTKTDTKYMYEFTHRFDGDILDSSIYVATNLRGGTVQKLHITEIAYIKNYQELKTGSKQAVPLTGTITEETTGNGFNEFYDDYIDALNNPHPTEMDYKCYFYGWIENPEYTLQGILDKYTPEESEIRKIGKEQFGMEVTDGQLLWRQWKMRELAREKGGIGLTGSQLFKQEYPLTLSEAFQSGVGNVFDGTKMDLLIPSEPMPKDFISLKIQGMDIDDPAKEEMVRNAHFLFSQGVWFWDLPVPNIEYVIGVDPSDGEGADFSSINVWIKESTEQVAQYYGKLRPDELADLIKYIAEFYNKAFVGVENNMLTTILMLSKIYDNYFFETKIDERTFKRTKKLGWNTNSKTRDVMIDEFIIMFEEGHLKIRSKKTIGEMKTFVKKDNGKREHADGKHDDSLFADFIAIQMVKLARQRPRIFAQKPVGF